ncbi:MAG: hypothetical protein JRI70_00465 [Deltaproteobacteria bacterium]|nr:hypothetical protein [Deltaproteobacteria bacterium]MBW2171175.1 hypothetical protein [Deltaproteobacteria bacterium]
MEKAELQEFLNKPVVLDTATPFIYIGTLHEVGKSFVTLKDVDVHHIDGRGASRETYALSAKKFGIKKNRAFTKVRVDIITSISHLQDIVEY